jgi:hypothetical protein
MSEVKGYRPLTDTRVTIVNANKVIEEQVLRILDELAKSEDTDKRWLAIGYTAIEQGFMAVNRSVFKPERVSI